MGALLQLMALPAACMLRHVGASTAERERGRQRAVPMVAMWRATSTLRGARRRRDPGAGAQPSDGGTPRKPIRDARRRRPELAHAARHPRMARVHVRNRRSACRWTADADVSPRSATPAPRAESCGNDAARYDDTHGAPKHDGREPCAGAMRSAGCPAGTSSGERGGRTCLAASANRVARKRLFPSAGRWFIVDGGGRGARRTRRERGRAMTSQAGGGRNGENARRGAAADARAPDAAGPDTRVSRGGDDRGARGAEGAVAAWGGMAPDRRRGARRPPDAAVAAAADGGLHRSREAPHRDPSQRCEWASCTACRCSFFPFLPEFERAIQSMIMVGLCAGAVATNVGYMPVLRGLPRPDDRAAHPAVGGKPGRRRTRMDRAVDSGADRALQRDSDPARPRRLPAVSRILRDAARAGRAQSERLQAALEQAEAANRAKTRFLAAASHDLRQPIHTLSCSARRSRCATSTREPARSRRTSTSRCREWPRSSTHCSTSRSSMPASSTRAARRSSRAAWSRDCARIRAGRAAKGLESTASCTFDGVVRRDRLLLERIVRNLVDNAIKYTDAGSVRLGVARSGDDVVIAVADTGRGIPASEHARVFEEFYQLDNPERDRTRGFGLGLSIVKRLADLLGMRLEMTSAPGAGHDVPPSPSAGRARGSRAAALPVAAARSTASTCWSSTTKGRSGSA